ncbi:MAG: hypothetical protein KC503_40485 [Myxococcales bacterium]|nr:hypothetical protein [Myxococcales bacterium]
MQILARRLVRAALPAFLSLPLSLSLVACGDSTPANGDGTINLVDGRTGGGDGGVGGDSTQPPQPDSGPSGLPLLGNGTHSAGSVTITVVAQGKDGLMGPRDLAFHPDSRGQLWIVNQGDESVVILGDATGANDSAQNLKRRTLTGAHFLAQPSGIAFGEDFSGWNGKRNFATIHETDKKTQGPNGTPADFMGPTLYTSDLNVFDGGHGGHLDMMHNSPNGMGIAWEKANVYWVFDGYHNSIARYDFGKDHGPGGTYHGDGSVRHYAMGNVKREPQVPSHMAFGPQKKMLYVADTGNARVAVIDTSLGNVATPVMPNYDGGEQVVMSGVSIRTFAEGSANQLSKPSGIAINDGVVFVSDWKTSRITAFDMQGKRLDWLDTGRAAGSLMGLAVGPDGNLYVVDFKANEVLRIEPK